MSKGKGSVGISVSKEKDISEWYSEVLQKAELADHSSIRGFMVMRPNSYSIWEAIQKEYDSVLRNMGVQNAYFPLLIPEAFFKKEAEHAEGFNPELAFVQQREDGGRLAIRPTSETIMYDSYAKWIRSHRDLPLKINQWANVLRWEVKQCKPFLRIREFLWQEGHCVFASEKEAIKNQEEIAESYKKLMEDLLAIPVLVGKKSRMETFAGAKSTLTTEALMPDGKALQMGTSHNLGQGFAKVFGISYRGKDEKDHLPWQTSWGFSVRMIGALIMLHGDDKGLVLPPRVARHQVVVVPIFNEENQEKILKKADALGKSIGQRVMVDERSGYSPGWKFNEWEMKGIPIRVEIGPKDIAKKQVVVVRRDNGKKEIVLEKNLKGRISKILEEMQKSMLTKAKKALDSSIDSAKDVKELKEKIGKGKIVKAYFVDDAKVEKALKDLIGGANSRIVEESKKEGKCVQTGKKTKTIGYFSKSY